MKKEVFDIVIETPKGSRNKYKYDSLTGFFSLSKVLPAGFTFPFDFGFLPGTEGGDGDPLDVAVITEEPTFTGCMISCRLLGVITAEQTGEKGTVRNDRLLAVPEASETFKHIRKLEDLGESLLSQLKYFFTSYHRYGGVQFKPLQMLGPDNAVKLIEEASLNDVAMG